MANCDRKCFDPFECAPEESSPGVQDYACQSLCQRSAHSSERVFGPTAIFEKVLCNISRRHGRR